MNKEEEEKKKGHEIVLGVKMKQNEKWLLLLLVKSNNTQIGVNHLNRKMKNGFGNCQGKKEWLWEDAKLEKITLKLNCMWRDTLIGW